MPSVKLTDLWQRRGFMNMPDWMLNALAQAFRAEQFKEEGRPGEASGSFLHRVQRWRGGGVEFDLDVLVKAGADDILVVQWSPPQFTLADVEVDLPDYTNVRVLPKNIETRWGYFPFAFGIYWALFYHVENAYLEQPGMMWDELILLVDRIYSGAYLGVDGIRQLEFALLERTLGLEYDRKMRLPHYIANISLRSGLRPEELADRIRLFDSAVAFFKQRLIENLTR